jgi:hypothetical protein
LENPTQESIYLIVDSIVSEKRMEWSNSVQLEVAYFPMETKRRGFAFIVAKDLKRILSNLLNNSREAILTKGKILIQVNFLREKIRIEIIDDGKGMSADVLEKILVQGGSSGKPNGMGLGLSHAQKNLRSWGGKFGISSTPGIGTNVTLEIPATAPNWFIPHLVIPRNGTVVILDDEPSVHAVWTERFNQSTSHGLRVEHFCNANELEAFVRAHGKTVSLFLIDQELGSSPSTGIELILKWGINKRAILVTGRYDEKNVRDRCLINEIKLIPKPESVSIPIVFAVS